MIRERISGDLKSAAESQDCHRAATLRLITAAIKNRDISEASCDNQIGVSDAEVMAILQKMIKQREESIRDYEEAGQLDLAESERGEIGIIREYLPRQMSENEQKQAIAEAITTTGAKSIRDINKVMSHLKTQHFGKMDFTRACADLKNCFR